MNHKSSDLTTSSLIGRVQAGDSDAWVRMSKLYGPLVYRWARTAGVQDSDASDIGQEVFQVVARRIGDFRHVDSGSTFRGWLWTITRNKLGDFFRRAAKQPGAVGGSEFVGTLAQLPDLPPNSDTNDAFDVIGSLAHRALRIIETEFEETTWRAFWLSVVEGKAHDQIAEELAITRQAVRQAKYRVTKRLRDELDDPYAMDGA